MMLILYRLNDAYNVAADKLKLSDVAEE